MKARKKVYFFEVEVRYEGNAPFPRTDRLRRWADKALSDHHHAPPCKSRLIRGTPERHLAGEGIVPFVHREFSVILKNGKIEIAGQNEIWMKVLSSKA